jgi:hypothetical protein
MKPIEQFTDDEWLALVRHAIAMPDVPPHLLQRALDLWLQRPDSQRIPVHGAQGHPVLKRWLAVLAFDSWATAPVAAGMRALPSEVRQLLYSADGCDIDLRVAPRGAAATVGADFTLSGQLLGPFTEGQIELHGIGHDGIALPGAKVVPVQPLGEFHVEGVHAGSYRITVRLGDAEIELPLLDVGPQAARTS